MRLLITDEFLWDLYQLQEKVLEEVTDNYYAYSEGTMKDATHQVGFFKNINGELVRTGTWKQYINGELRSVGVYDNDKLVKLVYDGVEYSAKDLYIYRLESRIRSLTTETQ